MTASPSPGPPGPAHGPQAAADPPSAVEDRRLVQDCLDAAPGSWDRFVDRFGGLLAYVVERTAGQRDVRLSIADRDDLVADVLFELFRNDVAALRSFAGRSSLATYLTVIARRVAVRVLFRSPNTARPVAADTAVDRADRDSDAARRIADRDEIEQMLGRLDEPEARLVRLHRIDLRSYSEISKITGMPLGSIGPALSRALRKLQCMAADGRVAS